MSKILAIIVLFTAFQIGAQQKSEQLREEQKRLEKRLSSTKTMLDKAKKASQTSMNELKMMENQVRDREMLVQNVDNQIRGAELSINAKGQEIDQLKIRLKKLKKTYKKLLLYAYKHRNKYGKMMFVFSSKSYFQAVKRNTYLKRISEVQKKQFKVILQSEKTIKREITSIKAEKSRKMVLLDVKMKEKELILKDKEKKSKVLAKFKKDEAKLKDELKIAEKQKDELKRKIQKAIEKEIAEATKKAEKEAIKKAELAKKTEKTNSKTTSKTTPNETATPKVEKKETIITETKENVALGNNFASNKGKLPWPVLKGTISEGYGKNAHPTLANVYTNNNGIDIAAPKNSQVRAVFDGEVSSVLSISGAGKVVIIKHGSYRTVYSNLQDVNVSVGSKVTTKQVIGSLMNDSEGSLSTSHFEIHQVIEGSPQRVNPTLWLAQ